MPEPVQWQHWVFNMASSVQVIDRGYQRIERELKLLDRSYTQAGFTSGTGEDVSEISQIAAFNNFGTKRMPAREFMGSSFDMNKIQLKLLKEKLYGQILQGQITVRRGLAVLGEFMAKNIQERIRNIKSPPLSPKTIRRKGSSNPLVDKGQMIQSVTHVEILR